MSNNDPISRRDLFRKKLGKDLFRSLGKTLGQAASISRELQRSLLEEPDTPPALPGVPPIAPPSVTNPTPAIPVFLRPPGSIDEIAFTAQCTKCRACIDACPPRTLVELTADVGKAMGTPVIDPQLGGCTMCDDRPCASACAEVGSGVIDPLLPAAMGHAVIHRSLCVSSIGDECHACLDACPIEHTLQHDWRKIPVVDLETCTGCGLCVSACPSEPVAISILPTQQRPPRTGSSPDDLVSPATESFGMDSRPDSTGMIETQQDDSNHLPENPQKSNSPQRHDQNGQGPSPL